MTDAKHPGGDRLDEAAAWHGALTSDTWSSAEQARFAVWLAADPANPHAYRWVEQAASRTAALSSQPAFERLRAETHARLATARRGPIPRPAIAAGIAALIVGASMLGWQGIHPPAAPVRSSPVSDQTGRVYATHVAQRLAISLPDGSTAILNTASRLRVGFTAGERRLVLERGQAYFDVAANSARPFVVAAGGRTVTAHGTQFDVRLRTEGVDVALFRGAVTVARPGAANGIALHPNQLLSITRAGASVGPIARVAAVESWRKGEVAFDDTPLVDAVAEMNRYVDRPAVVVSPALGAMRVSGVFRTDGMPAFLEALQAGFGVSIVARPNHDLLLESDISKKK